MSEDMKLRPQREVFYPLIEASDVRGFRDGTETPSAVSAVIHIVEVNFRQRTIVLPEGKFSLDFFLCMVEDMRLRSRHYDNPK